MNRKNDQKKKKTDHELRKKLAFTALSVIYNFLTGNLLGLIGDAINHFSDYNTAIRMYIFRPWGKEREEWEVPGISLSSSPALKGKQKASGDFKSLNDMFWDSEVSGSGGKAAATDGGSAKGGGKKKGKKGVSCGLRF
ncbi:hypothetical protein L1987_51607 [Smallanthus sonchifolius]|uniref:Uncharacterized protein n=1 Tax=Smallanthus sonchifolius TaxID=185202 RepID=A0ACB9ER69_9ASTR|nr:hypothetical protein L1987_51607 [Smallanthus sonchifolius]